MKQLFLFLFLSFYATSVFGQIPEPIAETGRIVGGAQIIKFVGNPNAINSIKVINEQQLASIAWDTVSNILWKYKRALAVGKRWVRFQEVQYSNGTPSSVDTAYKMVIDTFNLALYVCNSTGCLNIASGSNNDFGIGSGLSGSTTKEYYTNITDTTSSRKIAANTYELLSIKSYTPPKDTTIGANTYKITKNTVWKNSSLSVVSGQTSDFMRKNGQWLPVTPLSIFDFGAVGDGITNCDAAYNKYKAYNLSNGFSIISIPADTFLMTRWNVPAYMKIIGNGTRKTILKSVTKGYMLYCGDSTYSYGIELRDFAMNALNDSITAIRLINTAAAKVHDLYIEGNIGSTNKTIGVEVAGGVNGNIFSFIENVICNHVNKGFLFSRSSPTQTSTTLIGCNSIGDNSTFPGNGSIGLEIQELNGQGSNIISCNFESCNYGIKSDGVLTTFTGIRFEGNITDIYLTANTNANTFLGCKGIVSKTNLGTNNTFLGNSASDYSNTPNLLQGNFENRNGDFKITNSTDTIFSVYKSGSAVLGGTTLTSPWNKTFQIYDVSNGSFSLRTPARDWHIGTDALGGLIFRDNTAAKTVAFMANNGSFGINTSTPQKLGVTREITLEAKTNAGEQVSMNLSGYASTSGSFSGFLQYYNNNSRVAYIGASRGSADNSADLNFVVSNAGTLGTVLTLTAAKNAGFGTITPSYKVDIDAKIGAAGNPFRAQGYTGITRADSLLGYVNATPGMSQRIAPTDVVKNVFSDSCLSGITASRSLATMVGETLTVTFGKSIPTPQVQLTLLSNTVGPQSLSISSTSSTQFLYGMYNGGVSTINYQVSYRVCPSGGVGY